MGLIITNNASTTLASAAGASDTTLTVTDGSRFPSPSGSDYFLLTLASGSPETAWEIVKCTARSTNTLTVTRAQESTTAAAWGSGSIVSLRLTAGSYINKKTLSYFYDSSLATTDTQPVWRAPFAGNITAVRYYRNNTLAPTAGGTILIKKAGSTVYTVTIGTSDANQTWIASSTTSTAFAVGDKIEPTVSASGTSIANITVQVDLEMAVC